MNAAVAPRRSPSANEQSKRKNNIPVDKPFPGPDYFAHGRSLGGVLGPTLFDEHPHLGGKTKLLAGLWFGRPFPWAISTGTILSFMFPNGILPVKTSTASIANAKTSAGLDPVVDSVPASLGKSKISGARHREVPTAPGVAVIVKVGFEMMGPRP